MATVKQIMAFFGYASTAQFMKDWRALTEEEQGWFKTEVGKTL